MSKPLELMPLLQLIDGAVPLYVLGTGDNSRRITAKLLEQWQAAPDDKWKALCAFRTIGDVDLAGGALAAATVHDGVTAQEGQLVLVPDQTDGTENGVYVVPAAGAASRWALFDADAEVNTDDRVFVYFGTLHGGVTFKVTSAEPNAPGTDAITFGVWTAPGGSGSDADAIHDNVAGEIDAISEKLAPVAADLIIGEDSDSGFAKVKMQVGNLPGGGGGGGGGAGVEEIFFQDFGTTPDNNIAVDLSGHEHVMIDMVGVQFATSSDLRIETGDGAVWDGAASDYPWWFWDNNQHSEGLASYVQVLGDRTITGDLTGTVWVSGMNSADIEAKFQIAAGSTTSSDEPAARMYIADFLATRSHIRFSTGAANITGGRIRITGVPVSVGGGSGDNVVASGTFSGVTQLDIKDLGTLSDTASYVLELHNVTVGTDNERLDMVVSDDNLVSVLPSAAQITRTQAHNSGHATEVDNKLTPALFVLGTWTSGWKISNTAGDDGRWVLDLGRMYAAKPFRCIFDWCYASASQDEVFGRGELIDKATDQINALRIYPSTGGTFSGDWILRTK